jgi:hypothetical protein
VTPRLLRAQNRSNPVTSTTRSSPATETVAMSGSYRSFLWTRSAPALITQASAATHRHRDTVATEHAHPADSINVGLAMPRRARQFRRDAATEQPGRKTGKSPLTATGRRSLTPDRFGQVTA